MLAGETIESKREHVQTLWIWVASICLGIDCLPGLVFLIFF